ncbi:MAG: ATP-binding protein [Calothrix sp. MO_192.B10]|nr:ATP-binding protein [Calothrix sp. MO_192.B10]
MDQNNFLLRWFYNLPIRRKQLIGLFSSEIISILGLLGVGAVLIVMGGRSVLVNQAKSELAVTEINYNIKINQMGFGFRGQSDNLAIIAAAKAGRLNPSLKRQVQQILQNEIQARNIEYATLVGKDLRIIVNANSDRTGEIFNPDNLVAQVLRNPQQIKTSEIISREELTKESPPLPPELKAKQLLIRYTITPVKDPKTQEVIGALVSGDIVNRKLPIVNQTVLTYSGGYSAVYLIPEQGKFQLATASLAKDNQTISPTNPYPNRNFSHIPLPDNSLLESAVAQSGKPVAQRIKLAGKTYTMAAKTLSNSAGKPIAVLVRGTPETDLNTLLEQSLLIQILIASLALIIDVGLAILLGRAIAYPIKLLQKTTQAFSRGNLQERAEVIAHDEVGELATSFNFMAEELTQREKTIQQQIQQLQEALQQLKSKQAQLIQAEKMSGLGQMVAGIAHEINNPVGFIYGNIDYVKEYTTNLLDLLQQYQQEYTQPPSSIQETIEDLEIDYLREDLPRIINSLQTGAERISKIVNSLRNFSRLDESEYKAVDLHEGIENTLIILSHKIKKQKFTIELIKDYGNLPQIECYPSQINQVFMNLISNAIDALEEKGTNDSLATPQIHLRTHQVDNDWVAIHIVDNGVGIKEVIRSKLFNPFFTTKPIGKGTGLGLSISHQIVVEKHGGKLICNSKLGEGTEFVIEIPIRQSNELPHPTLSLRG